MNERSGPCGRSKQGGARKQVSGASKPANGRASGPVLQSVFLIILDHSAVDATDRPGRHGFVLCCSIRASGRDKGGHYMKEKCNNSGRVSLSVAPCSSHRR